VYNARKWKHLQNGVANKEFEPVEIKAFYVLGLVLEMFESVDCLLKAGSPSGNVHTVANEVFISGGRCLPAFGVFASGVELLGRCLSGNQTPVVNENLRAGFYYLAKPTHVAPPQVSKAAMNTVVVRTSRRYTVRNLIDLRNYATHGQSTVGQRKGRLTVPKRALPGIEKELFSKLPETMGNAIETYWNGLVNNGQLCERLGRARIDPYDNRLGPLQHVITYFDQIPYQSAGSLFSRFDWSQP
jgi:hypothetical protein